MEKIAFIVERLNHPPFHKEIATMTELDSKSSLELIDLAADVIVQIDPDQEAIYKEPYDFKISRIIQFLQIMKFNIPEEQLEEFQNLLYNGDKEILFTILHWTLQKFEHLQKRAYLAKFLMPLDIPAEFLNDDLIVDLSERLKELQIDFKEVHKEVEKVRSTGVKPSELKQEINQLEQEKTQLKNKIARMEKDVNVDEDRFREMLKATSALRKEQETEVMLIERLREHRKAAQEADLHFSDANRRVNELKASGIVNQNAQQILEKLNNDVRELNDRRDNLERILTEREMHLEKLTSWDSNDRILSEDDLRMKRDQVQELEDNLQAVNDQLDIAIEKNSRLLVIRNASLVNIKKLREKEEEIEVLNEEIRRINKQIHDREQEMIQSASNGNSGGPVAANGKVVNKKELKRYGAVVKDKIDVYKKMRDELSSLRSELVVLQRTEEILKGRDANLESLLQDLEREKGVEGYRDTKRAIIEMSEKAAEIDQMKGSTLEEISAMVEKISREFKAKQTQLQPIISQLKAVRQDYVEMESKYNERKSTYDKIAVGLEMDKQNLEKECQSFQEECLREESRFHYLQNMINISKIRLDRCEQEKKWQNGQGRMMRDFASLKELYSHKLTQQEQLTKQLRKQQKELKENSGALTNQKSNFNNLKILLDAKNRLANGEPIHQGYNNNPTSGDAYNTSYADPANYNNNNNNNANYNTSYDQKDYY